MRKINDLIRKLCPNGVEYKKLEECCKILDNKRKPVSKGLREIGIYPYYGANGIQDYINDYLFEGYFVLVGEDGSVKTDNDTPVVNWAAGKIWVNNHAHIIEELEGVSLRYLYHYLQIVNIKDLIHGNIPKLNQRDFRNIEIAVPPIEIQNEIVRILDKFGELEAEIEAELEARKSQYEFWNEKLFINKQNFVKRKLGDLCNVITGGEAPADVIKTDNPTVDHPYPVYGNGKDIYGYSSQYKIDKDSTVISSIGANTGAIYYHKAYFTPIVRLKVLIPKDDSLDSRYLYYALKTIKFVSKSGSVPNLNANDIKNIEIPITDFENQQNIIKILDQFDKLVNDFYEGIPAEIELRKKQYEYYRNKLLSFEEMSDND